MRNRFVIFRFLTKKFFQDKVDKVYSFADWFKFSILWPFSELGTRPSCWTALSAAHGSSRQIMCRRRGLAPEICSWFEAPKISVQVTNSRSHMIIRVIRDSLSMRHTTLSRTRGPAYSTWRACFHFSSITVKWDACRRCLCDHCKVLCAALKGALLRNVHRYHRNALASGFGSAALSYLTLNQGAMTVISW